MASAAPAAQPDAQQRELKAAISQVVAGRSLSAAEMTRAIGAIMDGGEDGATPAQIAALLVALRCKGESVEELCGAARAMRARAAPFSAPPPQAGPLLDTCGTGGDGAGTVNVSTLAALVIASLGVPVAKHGNRAQSSRSGSADLLEALGVRIDAPRAVAERCLREIGFAFLLAPAYHPATQRAAAVRRQLGVRTIFNLLGPLTNPAGVRHQVVGVFAPEWVEPLCRALGELGAERALVVHGRAPAPDAPGGEVGLDEISPAGETAAAEWRDGALRRLTLRPEDFGLEPLGGGDPLAGLRGGEPGEGAARARALLSANPDEIGGAAWRAVVLAAAAGLYVAGACDLREGAARSAEALRSGRARDLLERLVRASHG